MSAAPRIFSPLRRQNTRARMLALQESQSDAPQFLIEDMTEDVLERLAFLRHEPRRCLIAGDWQGDLTKTLQTRCDSVTSAEPAAGFNEEQPYPFSGFDFIASLGTLDTLNDLPGALIHLRAALAPGGLMIASFLGAGSLPAMRQIMLSADGERPTPRLHPMVDVRAGAQLLQRAGFSDPVADCRSLSVRYSSLGRLIGDLRAQGLSNVLASPSPALTKAAYAKAQAAFIQQAADNRVTEQFELVTLSGWRGPKI